MANGIIGIRAAKEAFKHNFWVGYQFDGAGFDLTTQQSTDPTNRTNGWLQSQTSSWFKFVNGYPELFYSTDWSLKRWYQWGQRNFHLHQPFGKPLLQVASGGEGAVITHPEHLAYQPDAYICARDGFVDVYQDKLFFNNPTPHLTEDFEKVWKALTTGQQGELTDQQWYEMTQWFNPNDPIKVIAYNGSFFDSMFYRWSVLFNQDYDSALQRLKDSVQPFINCKMRIGFDALTTSPGPIPCRFTPDYKLSRKAQVGWWEFFTWLEGQIGPQNIYMEAHPMRRTVYDDSGNPTSEKDSNPYVGRGVGVLCEDESSYFNASMTPDSSDLHYYSELGRIHYLRAIGWVNLHGPSAPKTRRLNAQLAFARYQMLDEFSTVMKTPRSTNLPSDVGEHRIIFRLQNAYGQGVIHEIAAIGLTQRFYQEQDPNSINDRTRFGFIIDNFRLQRFAQSQIPAGQTQFIDRFPNSDKFIQYLAAYNPPTLSTGDTLVSPPASE
jgi:hypothetical protein